LLLLYSLYVLQYEYRQRNLGMTKVYEGVLMNSRIDDLFLGIGAVILLETYILGTVVAGWAQQYNIAVAEDNIVWILQNDARMIKYWYSTSATYIFSIVRNIVLALTDKQWFIKLGISWFLCRLSNNILHYGRWKNSLFWFILTSFCCVLVIFWASCPPADFVAETLTAYPPRT
jgi:hypothetical protein